MHLSLVALPARAITLQAFGRQAVFAMRSHFGAGFIHPTNLFGILRFRDKRMAITAGRIRPDWDLASFLLLRDVLVPAHAHGTRPRTRDALRSTVSRASASSRAPDRTSLHRVESRAGWQVPPGPSVLQCARPGRSRFQHFRFQLFSFCIALEIPRRRPSRRRKFSSAGSNFSSAGRNHRLVGGA